MLLPKLDNVIVHNSVLCQLVSLSKAKDDFENLKKYLDEQKSILEDYIRKNPTMEEAFQDPLIFNELYYAYYYLEMNQPHPAFEHLQKGAKYLTPHTYFMYRVLYYDAYALYYRRCKEYDKALASWIPQSSYYRKRSVPTTSTNCLPKRTYSWKPAAAKKRCPSMKRYCK